MSQYGELLGGFDLETEKMYDHFDTYFNHPTMTKMKDVNYYSMYMSKTYCLLSNECRYIIVFVKKDDFPVETKQKLSGLKWDSLQTRTLPDKYNLPPHSYQPKKQGELKGIITRTNVTDDHSTYSCENYPITVTLLHTTKNKNEYQDKGNIIAALETYSTVITIV